MHDVGTPDVACACRSTGKAYQGVCVRTSTLHAAIFRAHGARYYRVYVKSVHRRRKQKNSYLRLLRARKRWSSRRGNPMWLPGGGRPHRAAPTQNNCPTHSFGIDTVLLAAGGQAASQLDCSVRREEVLRVEAPEPSHHVIPTARAVVAVRTGSDIVINRRATQGIE